MFRYALMALAVLFTQPAALAQSGARSGEQIVQAQCAKCHETGENGAPKIGDREAWIPRLKLGLDAVVRAAIRGHGNMPARGGMAELTDPEFRAAVVYLFNRGGAAVEGVAAAKPRAADPHRKVIGGTEILLGVVSAESLRAHGGDTKMHGGIPKGKGYYHINISLHDSASGAEIRDAQVEARVATALSGDTKKLELMKADKAVSYGNYFRMRGKDAYTITVAVRRPGTPLPIEARFDYKPD